MKSIIHFHKDRSDNSCPIVFLPEVEPLPLDAGRIQNNVVWDAATLRVDLTGIEAEGRSNSIAEGTTFKKWLIVKMPRDHKVGLETPNCLCHAEVSTRSPYLGIAGRYMVKDNPRASHFFPELPPRFPEMKSGNVRSPSNLDPVGNGCDNNAFGALLNNPCGTILKKKRVIRGFRYG